MEDRAEQTGLHARVLTMTFSTALIVANRRMFWNVLATPTE